LVQGIKGLVHAEIRMGWREHYNNEEDVTTRLRRPVRAKCREPSSPPPTTDHLISRARCFTA
jgi:hypothetical protein